MDKRENEEILTYLKEIVTARALQRDKQRGEQLDYSNMIDRLRREIIQLNQHMNKIQNSIKVRRKMLGKQSRKTLIIKQRSNSLTTLRESEKMKFLKSTKEAKIDQKYFLDVISKKRRFFEEQEERKNKQMEIASIAMNDNEDKQETLKRNILLYLRTVNKLFGERMDTYLNKNKEMEAVFRQIYDIMVLF